ncbi:PIN domain-containing protein [Luteolibacter arcticus]|uniref:Ribonuclease VapC n=1 Tax=Luteolibacter arcticus TaxID=1581411 RepID=A0ABT3GLD7_9BACT|nr:TA system VapC family ribonuclease toxin [Luteolibacter arcticus]MCW1924302.1 PIN domain-containing protein [Luteolibacter arcticus]
MSAQIDLPDVNVWVALTDTTHVHHRRAVGYWNSDRSSRLAFCSFTRAGMLRVMTNPKAMAGKPFDMPDAWRLYRDFADLPDIDFLADGPHTEVTMSRWCLGAGFPHRLWTDAWIAAIALENGYRVVSFDADFAKFPGLDFLHLQP